MVRVWALLRSQTEVAFATDGRFLETGSATLIANSGRGVPEVQIQMQKRPRKLRDETTQQTKRTLSIPVAA